jgi:hypothetical protein
MITGHPVEEILVSSLDARRSKMESTRYTVRVHGRLGPRSAPLGRMLRLGIVPRGGTPAAGPTFAAAGVIA